jgi:hypothetical protein
MRQLNTCLKCNYQWLSNDNPIRCAKCNSQRWNFKPNDPPLTKSDEIWLPMKKFSNQYLISNYGNLFSLHTNRLVGSRTGKIVINNRSHTIAILLLETFKPKDTWGTARIVYINKDKSDVRLANLKWFERYE